MRLPLYTSFGCLPSKGRLLSILGAGLLLLSGCASQQVATSKQKPTINLPKLVKNVSPERDLAAEAPLTQSSSKPPRKALKPFAGDVNDLVLRALDLVNIGYRYGGNNPNEGFDCSGFIQFLYQEQLGVDLPRSTREIRYEGEAVDRHDLQTGDLVFFNTLRRPYSHVGVYIGEGRFIHAPRSGAKVRIENMNVRYWQTRFNGGRRVVEPNTTYQSASSR